MNVSDPDAVQPLDLCCSADLVERGQVALALLPELGKDRSFLA